MRPRRLWLSLALQALVVLATGAAAAGMAVAGFAFGALMGPFGIVLLVAFLAGAALLGGLCFLAFGGLVGTLHGEPRGFWVALAAHAVVGLVLAGYVASHAAARPIGGQDTRPWLPALAGLGLVATSAALLLTPASREWYGV